MIIILFLILTLLSSCSPSQALEDRTIYLVSVADDFYGYRGDSNKLNNPINDQASLIAQFNTMENVEVLCFTSQNGKRYFSSSPIFIPMDSEDNELEDPSSLSFDHFSYKKRDGETELNWDMNTVLEKVGEVESTSQDLIIFTYSGHGEDQTGAFITNATTTGYKTMDKDSIIDRFQSIAGKKVFFIDSCYSGVFIPSSPFSSTDVFENGEERWQETDIAKASIDSIRNKNKSSLIDFWILSSCAKGQKASDSLNTMDSPYQLKYGAFTYFLLQALGFNTDRNCAQTLTSSLSFFEIYDYIRSCFPDYECQIQTPQALTKRVDILIR